MELDNEASVDEERGRRLGIGKSGVWIFEGNRWGGSFSGAGKDHAVEVSRFPTRSDVFYVKLRRNKGGPEQLELDIEDIDWNWIRSTVHFLLLRTSDLSSVFNFVLLITLILYCFQLLKS